MSRAVPLVEIELDKIRHLRFDFNAIVDFEDMTGKKITEIDQSNMSIKDVRALIFVALKHEDKDLTVEQVGAMLHSGSIDDVTKKITELFKASLPEKKEGDDPNLKPQVG